MELEYVLFHCSHIGFCLVQSTQSLNIVEFKNDRHKCSTVFDDAVILTSNICLSDMISSYRYY